MAGKADRTAYENKSERMLIEVVRPHDGLEKGCQLFKPYGMAVCMIRKGYWKEVKTNEE